MKKIIFTKKIEKNLLIYLKQKETLSNDEFRTLTSMLLVGEVGECKDTLIKIIKKYKPDLYKLYKKD